MHTSKFIALILRHDPERFGVTVDAHGYAPVSEVVDALTQHGHAVSRGDVEAIVGADTKRRYEISGDRIRASQGHSFPVDLQLTPTSPPELLYHGCPDRAVPGIMRTGIERRARRYVHLSHDTATADAVGARRGAHVVLTVAAAEMHADGYSFCVSANGVWLTEHVPPRYVRVPGAEPVQ